LELDADTLVQLAALLPGIETEDVEAPTIGDAQTREALDRRRLARAVAPEDAEDLAGSDREAHIIDRDGRPVGLVQVLDGDDRGASLPSVPVIVAAEV
jgi:ATP-binding cassette subfamily B protein